jgi:hypothetical protein
MVIDSSTTPQEIAALLASIRATIDRKAFDFTGIKKDVIDAYVDKLVANKRATLSDLKKALEEIQQKELNKVLDESCSQNPLLKDVAKSYFLNSLLNKLGLEYSLTTNALSKAYPELKIPMPKGRRKKE